MQYDSWLEQQTCILAAVNFFPVTNSVADVRFILYMKVWIIHLSHSKVLNLCVNKKDLFPILSGFCHSVGLNKSTELHILNLSQYRTIRMNIEQTFVFNTNNILGLIVIRSLHKPVYDTSVWQYIAYTTTPEDVSAVRNARYVVYWDLHKQVCWTTFIRITILLEPTE